MRRETKMTKETKQEMGGSNSKREMTVKRRRGTRGMERWRRIERGMGKWRKTSAGMWISRVWFLDLRNCCF